MLELADVKKSFREPNGQILPILNVRSFQLAEREQMVLVGRSGSGKTTLLYVIGGISRPDSGQVRINGTEITRLSEAARDRFRARSVGYVYQTFNLLPGFTALENVLLGMSFTGQRPDRQRAANLLKRVGLGDRLAHRPAALSVGEQQRVAVARALANRPKLLLADEPTASVDAVNQRQMIDLIRETCQEEGVALLLVTHAPEIASQFSRVEELEKINQRVVP
ncbi:MAG: ABC transporter ATP-binding protein [Pirellulales bacterium]